MNKRQFQNVRRQLNQTPQEFATTIGKSLRTIRYYQSGKVKVPKSVEILVLRLQADQQTQDKMKNISARLAQS